MSNEGTIEHYNANSTMRMIGNTNVFRFIDKEGFIEVLQANENTDRETLAFDMFMLGAICGVKSERKRRQKKD